MSPSVQKSIDALPSQKSSTGARKRTRNATYAEVAKPVDSGEVPTKAAIKKWVEAKHRAQNGSDDDVMSIVTSGDERVPPDDPRDPNYNQRTVRSRIASIRTARAKTKGMTLRASKTTHGGQVDDDVAPDADCTVPLSQGLATPPADGPDSRSSARPSGTGRSRARKRAVSSAVVLDSTDSEDNNVLAAASKRAAGHPKKKAEVKADVPASFDESYDDPDAIVDRKDIRLRAYDHPDTVVDRKDCRLTAEDLGLFNSFDEEAVEAGSADTEEGSADESLSEPQGMTFTQAQREDKHHAEATDDGDGDGDDGASFIDDRSELSVYDTTDADLDEMVEQKGAGPRTPVKKHRKLVEPQPGSRDHQSRGRALQPAWRLRDCAPLKLRSSERNVSRDEEPTSIRAPFPIPRLPRERSMSPNTLADFEAFTAYRAAERAKMKRPATTKLWDSKKGKKRAVEVLEIPSDSEDQIDVPVSSGNAGHRVQQHEHTRDLPAPKKEALLWTSEFDTSEMSPTERANIARMEKRMRSSSIRTGVLGTRPPGYHTDGKRRRIRSPTPERTPSPAVDDRELADPQLSPWEQAQLRKALKASRAASSSTKKFGESSSSGAGNGGGASSRAAAASTRTRTASPGVEGSAAPQSPQATPASSLATPQPPQLPAAAASVTPPSSGASVPQSSPPPLPPFTPDANTTRRCNELPPVDEVMKPALQDPILAPSYQGLPNLVECSLTSWSSLQGKGNPNFKAWYTFMPHMFHNVALEATNYTHDLPNGFGNPARMDPRTIALRSFSGTADRFNYYSAGGSPSTPANMFTPSSSGGGGSRPSSDNFSLPNDVPVPVYDARGQANIDFRAILPNLANSLPAYTDGEIPQGSFVMVGYTLTVYRANSGNWTLGCNVLWIIVIGCPTSPTPSP